MKYFDFNSNEKAPKFLLAYQNSDFITQMKANFIYRVSIATIFLLMFLLCTTIYIQSAYFGGINYLVVSFEVLCLVLMYFSIYLLSKGNLNPSIHFLLTMSFASLWAIMIVEKSSIISRIDSIAISFAVFSMTPLIPNRNKLYIILYSGLNILMLYIFTFYILNEVPIAQGELWDYFIDNAVSYLLMAVIAYNIFIIYQKATQRIKESLKAAKSAEEEVKKLNEELEEKVIIRTKELNEALKLIEDSNMELNLVNENLALESNKLHLLNEKLIKSEHDLTIANQTKDKFFSLIAHDLRNPFVPLLNSSELLDNYFDKMNDDEKIKTIRQIKSASKNIYNLLDNLLQWSRTQMGNTEFFPEHVNLFALLLKNKYVLQQQAFEKDIKLNIEVPEDLTLFADVNMINCIVRNLVNNAIKFTPFHGQITIGYKIFTLKSKTYDCIYVQDSGIGMNTEVLNSLFKGHTSKSGIGAAGEIGTGLGLVLCKEFIDKHSGVIWANSDEGKGSTFFAALPRIED